MWSFLSVRLGIVKFMESSSPVGRVYQRGNVTMAFTEYPGPGSDTRGRTFVLVHGIGMGRIVFHEVAEKLMAHGRVLAVDLPGFGDSPEPGAATSLEETGSEVAGFIRDEVFGPVAAGADEAGVLQQRGQVVLIGHSMGTQIVSEVAIHHPEYLEALVLIAPTVNRHERSAAKQAARMMQDVTGEGPKVLLLGIWEYAKTKPRWFINKLRFMLGHQLERIAPKISVSTLVLRGETDRVCPRDWVSEIAELIPGAVMDEIDGRGHEAIIRSPEPVASMMLKFIGVSG